MNENDDIITIYQKSPQLARFFLVIFILFTKYARFSKSTKQMVKIAKVMLGFSSDLNRYKTTKIISPILTIANVKKSSNFACEKTLKINRPKILIPKIQNPIKNRKSTNELDVNSMLSIV
jgi:hypothetical protein